MHVLTTDEKEVHAVSLKNILLATDGSPDAHHALKAAVDLARRAGASLHMVTAYQFPPSSVIAYAPYVGPDSAWDAFETDARNLLDAERSRVETLGARVDSLHVAREPAFDAIMDVAHIVDADLIVVGSRELDGLRRLLAGSVSTQVVHTVHRPVLIVRGGEGCWPPAHVIAGYDGTAVASGAALLAATITSLYDHATMSLVEAAPVLSMTADKYLGSVDGIAIEHGHVQQFAEELEPVAGRTVSTALAVGDPADALRAYGDQQRGASLIVVGTRGFGPVRRLFLGSVSNKLLHSGHTALLVVPGLATASD